MKFSNGKELRFSRPKFAKAMVWLLGVGGLFGILSWFIGAPAKDRVEGIGNLAIVAGLLGYLSGTVVERKEWQAKQKTETK